jgi:hypothetical protein
VQVLVTILLNVNRNVTSSYGPIGVVSSNLLIMPYWTVRHSPNSWRCRIMFICFLRCQDKVEYSLSETT